ncbi:MAG: tetratricopeptide repeat protein, partial [Pseudomonadota bacterium]
MLTGIRLPGSMPHLNASAMTVNRSILRAAVLAFALLWPAAASAQGDLWQSHMTIGGDAHQKGDLAAAETAFNAAIAEAEKSGPTDPRLAESLFQLAIVFRDQGKLAEAIPLLQRALDIREKTQGPEHPDLGPILSNLAGLRIAADDYAAAEQLYRRAFAIYQKLPDIGEALAQIVNSIAGIYYVQGRYGDAEPLYRKALNLREAVLGENHPDVASSVNNLAS